MHLAIEELALVVDLGVSPEIFASSVSFALLELSFVLGS